jgi:hypothetical protein
MNICMLSNHICMYIYIYVYTAIWLYLPYIEQSLEEAQNDVFSKEDKVNMSIIYIFMYLYLHVCSCMNIWLYLLIFAVYRAEFGRGSE